MEQRGHVTTNIKYSTAYFQHKHKTFHLTLRA